MPEPLHLHLVFLEESDRQAILLALALTSLQRPGWEFMLRGIAKKMAGRHPVGPANCEEMYEKFRIHNADRFNHIILDKVLPAGTCIRFTQALTAPANEDRPCIQFAAKDELGVIIGNGAKESYWVKTEACPSIFVASATTFEVVSLQPAEPEHPGS
jgi:hypothetical protein